MYGADGLAGQAAAEVKGELRRRVVGALHRERADERLRVRRQIDGVGPVLLVRRPRHPDLGLHLDRLGGVGHVRDRVGVPLLDHHLAVARLRVPAVDPLVGDDDAELAVLDRRGADRRRAERGVPGEVLAPLEGVVLEQIVPRQLRHVDAGEPLVGAAFQSETRGPGRRALPARARRRAGRGRRRGRRDGGAGGRRGAHEALQTASGASHKAIARGVSARRRRQDSRPFGDPRGEEPANRRPRDATPKSARGRRGAFRRRVAQARVVSVGAPAATISPHKRRLGDAQRTVGARLVRLGARRQDAVDVRGDGRLLAKGAALAVWPAAQVWNE